MKSELTKDDVRKYLSNVWGVEADIYNLAHDIAGEDILAADELEDISTLILEVLYEEILRTCRG